jgi:outer membrane PBP1 activator LpoA protein
MKPDVIQSAASKPAVMKYLFGLLLPILLLAGCASTGGVTETPPEWRAADAHLATGDARAAAQGYESFAANARGALHDIAMVRAASAWQQAGDNAAARRDLDGISGKRLQGDDDVRYRLLRGEFALADKQPTQAMGWLQPAAVIPGDLEMRWHRARASVLEQTGDAFGAATELAVLEPLLPRKEAAQVHQRISRLLGKVDDATLSSRAAALPAGHPLYVYAGRALTARGLPLPHPYARGAGWHDSAARPPADADGYRPPLKLALLLPASGSIGAAATAVRDGFMTAYYADNRRRPELRMYDVTQDGVAAYRKAVQDGNDLVVGPLLREHVSALFEQSDLGVPVLALNRGTSPPPPGSASFSLAPEDEGIAAAQRLIGKGLRRAIAIAGDDEVAQRSLDAFREAYAQRGGELAGEVTLTGSGPDYSAALKRALADAGDRYDAIFLVLKAPPARLVASQLPLAGYRDVPRISTSLILSGGGSPRLDQELDGIEYPELPWLLHAIPGLPDSADIGGKLGSARDGGARLYAFGADAYALSAYLESLALQPDAVVHGATGELRLDGFGNIQRTPDWAVFSGGRPRPAGDRGLEIQPVRQDVPRAGH